MRKIPFLLTGALAILASATASAQSEPSDEVKVPDYSGYILTPEAPHTPRINGAKIYGARPGSDFLYKVAATGDRPMTFSAENLPKGLKIDSGTGVITGKVKKAGTYNVTLKAANSLGEATREFRIVIGEKIALTPPMGWNSWNCWGNTVSHEKVMASAKAILESGLADYGWSYINIDDGWQGLRGGKENAIQPNVKFPDMKGLVDSLHTMGFKVGIYSGPWVATYAAHIGTQCDNADGTYEWVKKGLVNENYRMVDPSGELTREKLWYSGKYSFAAQDARQWAEWGFDYLKYDWNPHDWYSMKEMHDELEKCGRDIVYSLSNSALLPLADEYVKYANCWRTTGDIRDNWKSISGIGFGRNSSWAPYSGPGHWPDGDMMVIGNVGWGRKYHYTNLTPDEQYTHVTLWAMQASPLLIGCDMAVADKFTKSLLCNNEVIDINQDPLGYAATKIYGNSSYATYFKPLEDGSLAIAMFNLSETTQKIGFKPRAIGIIGDKIIVRDVWRQKDVAEITNDRDRFDADVPPHGVVLVRVFPGFTKERPIGSRR